MLIRVILCSGFIRLQAWVLRTRI